MVSRALFLFPGWAPSSLPASRASISFGSTRPCTSSAGLWCAATFPRPGCSKLPDRITSTWECSCSSSSCPPCPSCTWSCPSRHLSIVAPSGSCLCNFFWAKFSFRGGDGNGHSLYKLFFFPQTVTFWSVGRTSFGYSGSLCDMEILKQDPSIDIFSLGNHKRENNCSRLCPCRICTLNLSSFYIRRKQRARFDYTSLDVKIFLVLGHLIQTLEAIVIFHMNHLIEKIKGRKGGREEGKKKDYSTSYLGNGVIIR